MNIELKVELIRRFGSQIVASKKLGIRESKLSYIVQGHVEPSAQELKALEKVFGQDRVAELFKASTESSEQAGAV